MTNATRIEPELLSMKDTLVLLGGRSRQWVYDKLRSDPTFPRPVRSNPQRIEFLRSELMAWIAGLPRAELTGIGAIERRRQSAKVSASA